MKGIQRNMGPFQGKGCYPGMFCLFLHFMTKSALHIFNEMCARHLAETLLAKSYGDPEV